ncbi:MAG: hypothetical protein U0P81_05310 [Holophagaceae bacterium]
MRALAALVLALPLVAGGPTARDFLPGKRILLKGCAWAGWYFDGAEKAERYDEMEPTRPSNRR